MASRHVHLSAVLCCITFDFSLSLPFVNASTTNDYLSANATLDWNYPLVTYLENFPDPQTQTELCGGDETPGNVAICDPSAKLTPSERDVINSLVGSVCLHTPCPCKRCPESCPGMRTSIAVLPDLGELFSVNDTGSVRDQVDLWASGVRSQWAHVEKCNENILLVFVGIGRTLEITSYTGEVAKEVLSDECMKSIHHQLKPLLQTSHYGHAIITVVQYYGKILTGDFSCRPQFPYVMTTGVRIGIAFGAAGFPLLVCVIIVFFGPCFGGRGFGGARHKTHISTTYNNKYHKEEWETRWNPKHSVNSAHVIQSKQNSVKCF